MHCAARWSRLGHGFLGAIVVTGAVLWPMFDCVSPQHKTVFGRRAFFRQKKTKCDTAQETGNKIAALTKLFMGEAVDFARPR